MSPGRREAGLKRLPLVAAAFVVLVCVAILALSGWREWVTRESDLQSADVDVANLARSLAQHAEDTFELADTVLIGLVSRLETDGTGPPAMARLQSFIDLRKTTMTRLRGLFVYDETGRWLATSEQVDFAAFNTALAAVGFAGPTVYELVDGHDPSPRLPADLAALAKAGWELS